MIPGDQAKVSVLVEVPPADAFRIFTEEIDQWWRRGFKYRVAGKRAGIIHLEPKVGGRLFESFDERVVQTGTVTVWEPPRRVAFEWRAVNFEKDDPSTEVEVTFEESPSGTMVTVVHRGWSRVRPDHPARHGLEVAPFLRMMGLWWGDLMTSFRERSAELTELTE